MVYEYKLSPGFAGLHGVENILDIAICICRCLDHRSRMLSDNPR